MTSTRGGRLEADARREQLLSCAAQLSAERPYAQVSTTELAERAGIARGLLHHCFSALVAPPRRRPRDAGRLFPFNALLRDMRRRQRKGRPLV